MVDVPGPAARTSELTPRALAAGLLVGSLLVASNVYMGLATGFWDSGSLFAALFAFALLSATRGGGPAAGPLETNAAQAVATAMGAAPAAAGLLAAIPALSFLGVKPPGWTVAAFGAALGVLGVLLALQLRRRLLEEERLPFPTGIATAETISALHGGRRSAGRGAALLGAGAASAAATVARDVLGWLPQAWAPALAVAGRPAEALTLGVAASPMLLGAGILVGALNGLTLLAGALLAWAVAAPLLLAHGVVAEAAYAPLARWLVWPAAGLFAGSAIVTLGEQVGALRGALSDVRGARGARSGAWAGAALALGAAAVVAAVGRAELGIPLGVSLAVLLLSAVLGATAARAAGRTDISPAGDMGQLAQGAVGTVMPGHAAANVAGGAIAAGVAAQVVVALWSLEAGRRLGASAARLGRAMLLGVAAGAALAVPLYVLLERTRGLGSESLPAPTAIQWRVVAELFARGPSALPPGAGSAALAALALGVALELLSRTRLRAAVPPPSALAIAFIVPARFSLALAAGALLGAAFVRWRRGAAEWAPLTASGLIVGESIAGLAVAVASLALP
jgi:uncharacterized oligopeptide transporter (OPT) family protein